jgi:ketosteroid isomerase-like protein
MNTQENVQVVQQVYAALGKGDIPSVLNLLTDDVEWDMPFPKEIVPFGGKWQGREEVKKFFAVMHDNAEVQQFALQDYIAQNDKVVVIGHNKVLAKPVGRAYENDFVAVWTVENGKVKQMRDFMDTAQAVAAFRGE